MPTRKTLKGKKKGLKRSTQVIPRNVKSFPERLKATLYYNDYAAIATSSGTNFYEIILRGNSLYDPMYSGCTKNGQPLARDQWGSFYQSYAVHACSVRFTISTGSSTAVAGNLIAILHANDTTTSDTTTYADDPDTLMLQKDVKYKYCAPVGAGPSPQLSMKKSARYMMPNYNPESNVGGLASPSSPTDGWYYHLTLWDQARNVTTGTISAYVDVLMTFDCEFYDPVDLPAS